MAWAFLFPGDSFLATSGCSAPPNPFVLRIGGGPKTYVAFRRLLIDPTPGYLDNPGSFAATRPAPQPQRWRQFPNQTTVIAGLFLMLPGGSVESGFSALAARAFRTFRRLLIERIHCSVAPGGRQSQTGDHSLPFFS